MSFNVFFYAVSLAVISTILGQNNNVTTHVVVSNTTIVCPSTDIDNLQRINAELKETIIQMWSSLTTRLDALESRLSCVSNCSAAAVTNSTKAPVLPILEEKIYENLTINENWTPVYDQPYNHPTTSDNLMVAARTCANQVAVGARRNANDSQLALAAVGSTEVLQQNTALNKAVKFGDVYWYSVSKKSFGFSPNPTIGQNSADDYDKTSRLRLSWHLDQTSGGYRAGSAVALNENTLWRKVIYCLN